MAETKRSPVQTKVADYYDGLRKGVVLSTKCSKCGTQFLPPRADCSSCYSSELQWQEVESLDGSVLTFTTIHFAPESFEGKAPYTVAVVQLANGMKVSAWVEREQASNVRIGSMVRVVPRQFDDGRLGLGVTVRT